MEQLLKIAMNHKTSVPGALALGLVGLYLFSIITTEQITVCVSVLTAVGLMASKDA
jgi:hypothetical protein